MPHHRYQHSAGMLVMLPRQFCDSIIAFAGGEYPVLTVKQFQKPACVGRPLSATADVQLARC